MTARGITSVAMVNCALDSSEKCAVENEKLTQRNRTYPISKLSSA
jgi:hypothetical protein